MKSMGRSTSLSPDQKWTPRLQTTASWRLQKLLRQWAQTCMVCDHVCSLETTNLKDFELQFAHHIEVEITTKIVGFCESSLFLQGTSLATVREVSATGKLCLMGMDLQGVRELQANERVDGLYLYLAPPSMEVLEQRLRQRRLEDASTIHKRIQWAQKEVAATSSPSQAH